MVKVPIERQKVWEMMDFITSHIGPGDGYNWWVDTNTFGDEHFMLDEDMVDTGFITHFILKYRRD